MTTAAWREYDFPSSSIELGFRVACSSDGFGDVPIVIQSARREEPGDVSH